MPRNVKPQRSKPAKSSRVRPLLRRAAGPAAAIAVMAFFGVYAVAGTNGALAYGDYKRQLAKREHDYAVLDARREMLKNRVGLLDPRHANPDLVDELVRRDLNVTHPDEVIVPLK
jgi:cell division protein FtsB